jgi:hypothetical protein
LARHQRRFDIVGLDWRGKVEQDPDEDQCKVMSWRSHDKNGLSTCRPR